MRLKGSVNDLLAHMEMLGLARILEWDNQTDGTITVYWPDPRTMEIGLLGRELSLGQVAAAVRRYLQKVNAEMDDLEKSVIIGGKEHSPFSPRVAKELSREEWKQYFDCRSNAVDALEKRNPLFVSLLGALGSASYWPAKNDSKKASPNLDLGASLWEMAPRNSGSEFMRNKYLKLFKLIADLSPEDISQRLSGEVVESRKETRNPCGFRCPGKSDLLMSWIAYQGISCFPTRAVTEGGSRNHDALSVGTMEVHLPNDQQSTYFVLPVPTRQITLSRYLACCRYQGLCIQAEGLVSPSSTALDTPACATSAEWLKRHGIGHVAMFLRHKGGTKNCPEYWAEPGRVAPL